MRTLGDELISSEIVAVIELVKNATGFGLYDRRVIEDIRAINDPYPYFRGLICDLGYERAVFADTVEDALAQARLNPPDLISADYRIIGGTGLQAQTPTSSERKTSRTREE